MQLSSVQNITLVGYKMKKNIFDVPLLDFAD